MPWHEKVLIAAVAVVAVIVGIRWLLDQLAKGMDG